MDEHITKHKIEIAIDLICRLYEAKIITHAFITGSVAKGTARKESDIDVYVVNPSFIDAADIPPDTFIYELLRKEEIEIFKSVLDIVKILKDNGVEFKQVERKDEVFWYQFYRGELFHLMTRNRINPFMEGIEITRYMCTT